MNRNLNGLSSAIGYIDACDWDHFEITLEKRGKVFLRTFNEIGLSNSLHVRRFEHFSGFIWRHSTVLHSSVCRTNVSFVRGHLPISCKHKCTLKTRWRMFQILAILNIYFKLSSNYKHNPYYLYIPIYCTVNEYMILY